MKPKKLKSKTPLVAALIRMSKAASGKYPHAKTKRRAKR
jgi:hypothetical protein